MLAAPVSAAFVRAYLGATGDRSLLPARDEDFEILLQAFVMDKALYDLG